MDLRTSCVFACFACLSSAACGGQVLDVGSERGAAPDDGDMLADPSRTSDGTTASPNRACVELGPAAKLLFEPRIGDAVEVSGLVPDGETLWVDVVGDVQRVTGPPRSYLTRLSVRKGTAMQVPLDDYRNLAGVYGGRLVYIRRTELDQSAVEDVVIRDLVTGASEVLPNARTAADVHPVRIHPSGIFWEAFEADHTASGRISRFTNRPRELTKAGSATMVTDGRELFYTASGDLRELRAGDLDLRLEAVPITGGEPRELRRLPTDHSVVRLVGVDETEVYFTRQPWSEPNGVFLPGDLVALKKDGGGERVVASGQMFRDDSVRLDPDFVTWLDGAIPTLPPEPPVLLRVRRTGGAVERIQAMDANHGTTALTVDHCNIYWATTNPVQVYGRSRLP